MLATSTFVSALTLTYSPRSTHYCQSPALSPPASTTAMDAPVSSAYDGAPAAMALPVSTGSGTESAASINRAEAMRTWEMRPVWEVAAFNPGTTNSNTPLAGAHTQVHWLLRLPPRAWETVLSMILVADVDADDVGDADNADDADDVDCEMSRYKNNYREVLKLSQLNKSFARTRVERFLPWRIRLTVIHQIERKSHRRYGCYLCFTMKHPNCFQSTTFSHAGPPPQFLQATVWAKNEFTGARTFIRGPEDPRASSTTSPPRLPVPPSPGSDPDVAATRRGSGLTTRREWEPSPPGAGVGEVESLRRYCIRCALGSGLTIPGDVIVTMCGVRKWICDCGLDRSLDVERCAVCGKLGPVSWNRGELSACVPI